MIRRATVDELLAQGEALFRAHYRDTRTGIEQPLHVRADLFRAMEKAGVLLAFGAFDRRIDGDRLVGYALGTVTPHPYSDDLVASACAIFVHADYRRGGTGSRLIDELEAAARSAGATVVQWHAKRNSHFERILHRRRMLELEVVYTKRLDHG